jgi:hypothetical protein
MFTFLKSMLSSEGEISSKRVCAFALIISGIIYAFIYNIEPNTATVAGVLIGGGTGILIGAALSKT